MFVYQLSEATAGQRRVPLHLVDATDGITAETGETGGQPQLSKNGAAFGNTTATLVAVGNGMYYVELTAAELDTVGFLVIRYKSAATAEAQVAGQVVSYDPYLDFTTSITAIKVPTDKLTFTVANQIDANVLDWKSAVAPAMTGDAYARLGAPAGASVSADVAAVKVDTAAVKVTTDKFVFTVANQVDSNVLDWKSATAPAMTGDAFARLGAPVGASISADIAAVKANAVTIIADTDDIQTRLPAALVSGRIDASVGAMAANVLTATAINADAITAAKIADGAIDAATFAASAITATVLAADCITAAKIADGAIDAATFAADSITAAKIADGAIDAATFAAGAINAAAIAADAITAAKIADGAIDAATFAAGAINAAAIAADAITDAKVAADVTIASVTGAVGSVTGAVGSVTGAVGSVTGLTAATVHADLDDIQARLPAALTANGNIKADTLRIAGTVQTAGDVTADTAAILVDTGTTLDAKIDAIDNFVDTEVSDILTDTSTTIDDLVDDLESRLTAALATALTAHSLGVGRGVVDAGSTTTALKIKTVNGAGPDVTNDHYNGRHVVFTSGDLILQAASITDYVGATGTATISAVTDTPADNDTFIIV